MKMLAILLGLAAFCGAVAIGLDQFGAVEPEEVHALIDEHPCLRRTGKDAMADQRITRAELRRMLRYLDTHDHATECSPLLVEWYPGIVSREKDQIAPPPLSAARN